jgi:hypothetical protein
MWRRLGPVITSHDYRLRSLSTSGRGIKAAVLSMTGSPAKPTVLKALNTGEEAP